MSCLYRGGLGQDGLSSHFQLVFGPEDLMLHLDQSIFIAGAGRVILPAGTGSSSAQLGSAGELGATALVCQVTTQPTCQARAGSQLLTGTIPAALARVDQPEIWRGPRRALCLEQEDAHGQVLSRARRFKVWSGCFTFYTEKFGEGGNIWEVGLGERSTTSSPSRPLHSCLRHKIRQAAFCTEKNPLKYSCR